MMTKRKYERFAFTVAQLIEVLQNMPQELPVVVNGYENGFENFYHPCIMKLKHEPENRYWDGEFQNADEQDKNAFEAVVLRRVVRDD